MRRVREIWLELSTLVYLFLPAFLFFWGWLKPVFAILCTLTTFFVVGLSVMAYRQREPDAVAPVPQGKGILIICLLFSLGWCTLSGAGGIGFERPDWLKHNAILIDLSTRTWPVAWDSVGWKNNTVGLPEFVPRGQRNERFSFIARIFHDIAPGGSLLESSAEAAPVSQSEGESETLESYRTPSHVSTSQRAASQESVEKPKSDEEIEREKAEFDALYKFSPQGDFRLVYYFGYYLVPALVGKWCDSWQVTNISVFVFTLLGIWLSLLWVTRLARCKSIFSSFWICVFFIFVAGWDWFGHTMRDGPPVSWYRLFEWWSPVGAYHCNTSNLYWAPQHTLGGWLPTALALDQYFGRRRLVPFVMPLLATLVWTPFASLGLFPFCWLSFLRLRLWGARQILASVASLVPLAVFVAFYGSLAKVLPCQVAEVEHNWIFDYLQFLVLEVGVYLIVLALFHRQNLEDDQGSRVPDSWLLLSTSTVILLVPFFCVGVNNDSVMRFSIPVLFVLSLLIAQVLVGVARARMHRHLALLIAVILPGIPIPFTEMSRSIRFFQTSPPPMKTVPPIYESVRMRPQYIGDGNSNKLFFRMFDKGRNRQLIESGFSPTQRAAESDIP